MEEGPQLFLKCQHCEKLFKYNGGKRRKFCSDKCKVAAWRQAAAPVRPVTAAEAMENIKRNAPKIAAAGISVAEMSRRLDHVTDKPEQ